MALGQGRRKMAKREAVWDYWLNRLGARVFQEKGIEISPDGCFACGDGRYLERAHIQAHSEGGSGDVENLHLLCKACHFESEHLAGVRYWDWLAYKNQNEYKPAYDHTLERMKRLGFSMDEAVSIMKAQGHEAATAYAERFIGSGQ